MADYERWNNLPAMKARRRQLRAQMTTAEAALWRVLRKRQVGGLRFRRQHSLDAYVLDFYCPAASLAIGVDGGVHADPAHGAADTQRQRDLEALGIRVLRFTNAEVLEQSDLVAEAIRQTLTERQRQPVTGTRTADRGAS